MGRRAAPVPLPRFCRQLRLYLRALGQPEGFEKSMRHCLSAVLLALACAAPLPALAATCGDDASGFDAWLPAFKSEAAAKGVSQRALAGLSGVTYNTQVISLDRHQ